MEKLLKRVVSFVCAIALVVAGLVFTPAQVSAETKIVPTEQEVQAGAWGLFTGDAIWAGTTKMQYETNGSGLGDTKIKLLESPYGNYNQVSWGTYARLANYLSTKNLKEDESYRLKLTMDIDADEFVEPNEQNGRNIILVNIQGNVYKVKVTSFGTDQEFEATKTFDYDAYAGETGTPSKNPNDVYIYLAGLKPGAELTIKSVDFVVDNDGWEPVPNWDPKAHEGEDAVYTKRGDLSLLAMRNPTIGHFGQLKTKKVAEAGKLSDYKVRVTNPGWTDYSKGTDQEGRSSWSASIRLVNYLGTHCTEGVNYKGVLKIKTNKATEEDNKGRMKTLMMVVDGKLYESPLTLSEGASEEVNEIEIPEFEYSGNKPDIDIDLDGLEPGTEFTIESFEFSSDETINWQPVPNEESKEAGRWELFARFATGIGDDNGQWGKLSYATAPDVVGDPKDLGDTLIKVRSSSGWHGAWATLATAHHYITEDHPEPLEVGKAYKLKVTYYSNKESGKDSSGRDKNMMVVVDGHQLTFPLEKCEDSENFDTYKSATTDYFVYDAEQSENDPTAVVLNMDRLDPGTILRIADIEFVPVGEDEYEWIPVRNDKFKTLGNTNMQAYGRFDESGKTGSWGKVSYKFDTKNYDDFSDVTILNRSVSGWYVDKNPGNPANAIDFVDVDKKYGLHKGCTYTGSITFEDEVTDETSLDYGIKNEVMVRMDGADYDHCITKTLNGGKQETTLEIPKFVYSATSPDLRIIMDCMTPGSTLKVKKISFTQEEGEPVYKEVKNDTATESDPWVLYSVMDGDTETWGEMLYAQDKGDGTLGDTEMYCWSVSGWYPGKAGILATLPDWTKNKMQSGKNYAVYLTIYSSEDNFGKNPDSPDGTYQLRVTINNHTYDLNIYKDTHTYVIPRLSEDYARLGEGGDDIVFNFDSVKKGSKFRISDITWTDLDKITEMPVNVKNVNSTVSGNSAHVTWEQDGNIYGTLAQPGGFKVYVDGKLAATTDAKTYDATVTGLSGGKHTVKVVAVLGAVESAGQEVTVDVKDVPTTTQAPPVTTQSPSVKPTAGPDTTTKSGSGTSVKKPGKVKVKKVAKRKKSAKKIKVTLKKVAGAAGYQVGVFKKKASKKPFVKKYTKKTKVTIKSKKIKGKKTIFVKARAYVLDGTTKIFGAWGKAKKSKAK
ncbi:MAG: hypothetical protein K6E58_02540 [Eubacterium sp.]|nr:hypothetical protein [Eubacterium sp.]